MAGRRLSPEEQAIWSRLARSVSPMPGRQVPDIPAAAPPFGTIALAGVVAPPKTPPPPNGSRRPSPVLDASWERRIANGTLAPDMAVDLHGCGLDAAHARLDRALADAVRERMRVLLVITGNPRPVGPSLTGEKARGAIRAEIGDWLALSRHADRIASVRIAHPRHGGRGALYVILRRER